MLLPKRRAFIDGAEMTVENACAENGCWALVRSIVEMFARMRGLCPSHYATLFDLIFAFVKDVLHPISDEKALEKMSNRLKQLLLKTRCVDDVLQVDEASQLLAPEDIRQFKQEQTHGSTLKEEIHDYEHSLRSTTFAIANKTAAGAKEHKKIIGHYKGPTTMPKFDHFPQAEVKKLLPPLSECWRSRTCNSWVGRFRDFPPSRRQRRGEWRGARSCEICITPLLA